MAIHQEFVGEQEEQMEQIEQNVLQLQTVPAEQKVEVEVLAELEIAREDYQMELEELTAEQKAEPLEELQPVKWSPIPVFLN